MIFKKLNSLVRRFQSPSLARRFQSPSLELKAAGKTHVGRVRSNNEDCFAVCEDEGLFIVCDGMGGHAGGEIASSLAVKTIRTEIAGGKELREAVALAHEAVCGIEVPGELGARPGSTVVALKIEGNTWQIGWVGDSRIWLFSEGKARQLTVDHTVVQQMVNWGDLTPEEALSHPERNRLSQALGIVDSAPVAGLDQGRLAEGMVFLLASDGMALWDEPEKIAEVIARLQPVEAVERLIELSLEAGGHDNVSCIIVECCK